MRSPKDMQIIQIDITNACVHTCSNCTRFCGHHKKPFFMSFEFFQRAVDSLSDYNGMVGIIGGEPTLHPEFDRFAEYLRKKRIGKKIAVIREPVHDMQQYILKNLCRLNTKAGLWSSLSAGYYKHFEAINDTFATQYLNDHENTCLHQALLMPRKDLNIPDNEWIEKRNKCWIQNTWSATITPKGAFFCEVAGALDMLFNGNGGWDIETGWWKRTPEEFGKQLNWCEYCSACLDVPKRLSNDGRDDTTPNMLERLKNIGSPKALNGKCVIHDIEHFEKGKYKSFTGHNDYMEAAGNQRTSHKNRNLYPKEFVVIHWRDLCKVVAEKLATDWIIVSDDDMEAQKAEAYFKDVIINPGCLYKFSNSTIALNINAKALQNILPHQFDANANVWGCYDLDKIIVLTEKQKQKSICISEAVPKGARIVIYGAGKQGRILFDKLAFSKEYMLCGWFDRQFEKLGYPVQSPYRLKQVVFDFVLVAVQSRKVFEEINEILIDMGIEKSKIIWNP